MNKYVPQTSLTTCVPHKHAEVIKAWADGKPIQILDMFGDWVDLSPVPVWGEQMVYRIKPEPKYVTKYKIAIYTKDGWELLDEYYDPSDLCMIGTIILTNTAKQFEVTE